MVMPPSLVRTREDATHDQHEPGWETDPTRMRVKQPSNGATKALGQFLVEPPKGLPQNPFSFGSALLHVAHARKPRRDPQTHQLHKPKTVAPKNRRTRAARAIDSVRRQEPLLIMIVILALPFSCEKKPCPDSTSRAGPYQRLAGGAPNSTAIPLFQ